jgi:hypothetical protein
MAALVGTPLVLSCAIRAMIEYHAPERFREVVADPGGDFRRMTGLPWPRSAKVLFARDTHGGFKNDGGYCLVFGADHETLTGWLSKPSPWGKDWRSGPVPREIGRYSEFAWSETGGPPGLQAPVSETVRFVAQGPGTDEADWHRGVLLIIDAQTDRV